MYNQDPNQYPGVGTFVQMRDYQVYDAYGALSGRIDTISYPSIPMDLDPVGFGGEAGYYTDVETGMDLLGHGITMRVWAGSSTGTPSGTTEDMTHETRQPPDCP